MEVALIILPRHAISLQALHKAGAWPAIERWKRDLVAALDGPDRVEPLVLWDFMSFDGRSAESVPPSSAGLDAKMRWHWDAVHVRPEFGNLVIDRILGGDASNADSLGVRLTTSNLESHLARLERKRSRLLASPSRRARAASRGGAPPALRRPGWRRAVESGV